MTTVAIIQARTTSSRLPGKVLLELAGKPVLVHIVERARRISGLDRVSVAIPEGEAQRPLADLVETLDGVVLARGPEEDLTRRFAIAAELTGAATIVRLYADCPAVDPAAASALLAAYRAAGVPFARICADSGYPEGFELQVISIQALLRADREARDADDREMLDTFFIRQPERFPAISLQYRPVLSSILLLLDTPGDYEKLQRVFDRLYRQNPEFGLSEIEFMAKQSPELFQ